MNAIVVGTDGSPGAEAAIQQAIDLTKGSGATVHLVCAYPSKSALERLGLTGKHEAVDLRGVASDIVARDEYRFTDAGFTVEKHVREGDPAHTLIDVAREQHADMIVVGAHGTSGLSRFALGGVSGKLSHHAPGSLLIVREP